MTNSNFENVQGKKDFRANNNYEKSNSKAKYGGNRESGGFRIRLSENEMKAVRAIQENFKLKSTVAVLGFSVRTLSEIIKDKELKDLVSKYAQNNKNPSSRFNNSNNNEIIKNKVIDPLARPIKSQPIEKNTAEENNITTKNINE